MNGLVEVKYYINPMEDFEGCRSHPDLEGIGRLQ
jgi:hypothetical protein